MLHKVSGALKRTIQNEIHSAFLILRFLTFLILCLLSPSFFFFSISCGSFPETNGRVSVSVPWVVNNSGTSHSKPRACDVDLMVSQCHSIKSHDCLHFTLWIQRARFLKQKFNLSWNIRLIESLLICRTLAADPLMKCQAAAYKTQIRLPVKLLSA
jgi:hypothetical protein